MHPVTIDSERLRLREFTEGDVDALLRVYGDPQVVEHMSFEPRNREQVEATVQAVIAAAQAEPRTEYSPAGVDAATDELVSFARLAIDTQHPGQNSGQIGFTLRADLWGRGLGTELARLLLRLGFDDLGLYRVWGARSPQNVVSGHVMGRLGMIEEGRVRGHLLIGGSYRDSVVHSILAPEWSS
ncbi:GNAT family N-acetyltransferase [Spongiactinospora gelatinilytica]|uniref:GNAT family N-acetyltransferase n=1 Tax=Spongiactinospora gelatinilytica TaxID=2666298 RepID=A0A2W2FWU1_9ACTN|nr:GNAT family protein [Spongiactinospora gelatinilytica]PZG29078.1 GNAT family N-acetyltransferase [Spongiactinospora gelatinilytica]